METMHRPRAKALMGSDIREPSRGLPSDSPEDSTNLQTCTTQSSQSDPQTLLNYHQTAAATSNCTPETKCNFCEYVEESRQQPASTRAFAQRVYPACASCTSVSLPQDLAIQFLKSRPASCLQRVKSQTAKPTSARVVRPVKSVVKTASKSAHQSVAKS